MMTFDVDDTSFHKCGEYSTADFQLHDNDR